MTVPVEFRDFARLFLQDSLEESEGLREFVARAVQLLAPDKMPAVKAYIDGLLDSQLDEITLDEIWKSCRPNYWMEEGRMRAFLSDIREQLDRAEAKSREA